MFALPLLLLLSLSCVAAWASDAPANPLDYAPSAAMPAPPPADSDPRVADAAFFAENAKRPGMQQLPSGAQAIRRKAGSGASARGAELVVMNISRHALSGGAADGEQTRHEQRYVAQQLPRELYEAVQLMQEGDQWEVYVPAHPAKRHRNGRPSHPGQASAAFTIDLLSAH